MKRRSKAKIIEPLLIDVQADTRERLLHVAMQHFALYGIDRVSLKSISDASGNRNRSAVGYHFENKEGLINAVLFRLSTDLAPKLDATLLAYETKLESGEEILIDEVILDLLTPVFSLYSATAYGPDGLRVLARIMHDPVQDIPDPLRETASILTRRITNLLHRLLPRKKLVDLQHHVLHATMATVNGLALQQRFVGATRRGWSAAPLADIFLSYVSYVVAGVASGPLNLRPGVVSAWKARLAPQKPTPVD
jgi:AcrR family transcriptional regulator